MFSCVLTESPVGSKKVKVASFPQVSRLKFAAFLISSIRATYTFHLNILDLLFLIILGGWYWLTALFFSCCWQPYCIVSYNEWAALCNPDSWLMRQLSREPTSFHCILFRRSVDDVRVGEEGQRRENRWHSADFCCFLKAKACLGHLEHLSSDAKKC